MNKVTEQAYMRHSDDINTYARYVWSILPDMTITSIIRDYYRYKQSEKKEKYDLNMFTKQQIIEINDLIKFKKFNLKSLRSILHIDQDKIDIFVKKNEAIL